MGSWGGLKRVELSLRDVLKLLIFLWIINTFILISYCISNSDSGGRIVVNVTRVIDGDTFESGDEKFRLLGINTPEKNNLGYEEAKNYLKGFEGGVVEVEVKETDMYGRKLGYVYFGKELINKEILEKGFGSLYYYEKDGYFNQMEKAEKNARENGLGIWEKSDNFGCVELINFKYEEEERCENQEQLVLFNSCGLIKGVLKDDATHIFKINLNNGLFSMNFSCVWNNDGDSLYLWDSGGLVGWYRYN